MQQNRWIPWGSWGARARLRARLREREAKDHKAWNLPQPLPEPFLRAAGEGLAQGRVALM